MERLLAKKDKIRIDISGGSAFGNDTFSGLSLEGLPAGPNQENKPSVESTPTGQKPVRLEVKREKSGRAGKTVTVIYGVAELRDEEISALLKQLKKRLATGGTITKASIEIQGDFANRVMETLEAIGYRAIRAGG